MPGPFYFAYAGGAIEGQITLVTNGSTHGALFETVSIVGDVTTGSHQLVNLASNQGLQVGDLYQLAGPGIPSGTLFLYDESVLSGLSDSINLNQAASATLASATFTATRAVNVAAVLGDLTQGNSGVAISGAGDLPAGTYGIFGTGIGEANVPLGTETGTTYTTGGGVLIVGSCFVHYDGAGNGTLAILAATPHTSTHIDMFGQTVSQTTYTVAEEAVRATASGTFALQITGHPVGDNELITDIPAGALTDLLPGLLYNVSGNGIPVGATFVAPSSGATEISLDLAATTSEPRAILTITGPRTPNAPFDPAVHNRFDEEILSVEISQDEGGFATLTVLMPNPDVGLLAPGRNLWAWLSWDQAWTPEGSAPPDLVPLFNGRLIGAPRLQAGETVQLQFLARPDDLNAQKLALSESLQVRPYFDPVWLAANVTPDTVLEAYSALWHIDRTSLGLTISDICAGEDGTVEVGEAPPGAGFYDRFTLSYGQPPLIATTVTGTVTWHQQAEGLLDVTQSILDAFGAAGSAYKQAFHSGSFGQGGGGLIQVLCGDGMKNDWPRPGTSIGGGWSLSTRNDGAGYPYCYILDAVKSNSGGWLAQTAFAVSWVGQQPIGSQADNSQSQSNVNVFLQPFGTYTAAFPLNAYKVRMTLDYRADRTRTETVSAVLVAGVQRELSDSAESDREALTLSSQFVGQAVDPGGTLPIGNVAFRSYFQTERGNDSFAYLLLAARAKMRARARAVDITFAVDWPTAIWITLRHSVHLTDRRLPGGSCIGKVKSYRLTASTAGMLGEFTLGCTIGTGEASTGQAGTEAWCNPGYVNSSYQMVEGAQLAIAGGEFYYQTLDDFAIDDDGLDLGNVTRQAAVNECVVINGLKTQITALSVYQNAIGPFPGSPIAAMRSMTTTCTLDLKPVQGAEFHTGFFPAVSILSLPKTIDLAAPTAGD